MNYLGWEQKDHFLSFHKYYVSSELFHLFLAVWIFKTHLNFFPYLLFACGSTIALLAEIWTYCWKVIWEKYEELRRKKKKNQQPQLPTLKCWSFYVKGRIPGYAMECTSMWADFQQTLFPSFIELVDYCHSFHNPVGSSDPYKLENIIFCLLMIQLMPYSSWNFNLWYFLCLNICSIDNKT